MRGGNFRPIEGLPNTSRLSLRERKDRVKHLKDEIDAIGTRHRERKTAAVAGVYHKVSLLPLPPTLSWKLVPARVQALIRSAYL